MAPDLIIEELPIASAETDELTTADVWAVLMTFFTILNPNQSYPFQNNFKNIPIKVTSKIEAAFKQVLQMQAYHSYSLKYSPVQAML